MTPGFPRLAVAIRAGTQPLGTIWVIEAAGELDDAAVRALEHSAEIAALHLLRARSAADLAREQRSELLRRLLEGGDTSRLVADELALDQTGPFMVLAFQPELNPPADKLWMVRLVDLIAMHCESHQRGTECVVIGNTVYALFSGAAAEDGDGAEAVATRLVARAASALRIGVRVSIGSPVPAVGHIGRSRRDADLILLLANRSDSVAVASARDVRSRLAMLELAQVFREAPLLMSEQATRMLEHDTRMKTDYATTLRTYLDSARDSAVTAKRLSLHQNTLRYRLRRAGELFGVDLDDPEDTLMLWLSLRMAEFD